ncbi:gliding motility-associated C-terminal domain-containing protein [Mesonia sp. K7]|uniref:T9SS type B sorting domain-containing protein n=1 Tax=Mesonia sp. K7 TaxID=2218606 RepID=UPI000DAA6091|nr:gliding motility-associated C-terminal domain-containing protein [Mesonia sp. K7]PZD76671.1 hypothetical protein DNG35_11405 [Mesonia sp. K7]
MKKILLYLSILMCFMHEGVHAQLESAHWFFNYGGLDFTTGTPVAKSVDFWGYQHQGGTSISTANGNLLFHGSGSSLINSNGSVMDNGAGLIGGLGNSYQPAITVPYPANPDKYYVFQAHGMAVNIPINAPFMYSVVDMTLDGGLGGVVSGQKNIPLDGNWPPSATPNPYHAAKVTAIPHANNQDVWAVVHRGTYDYNASAGLSNVTGHFAAFLVTSSGVQTTPVVSNEFPLFGGYFRISPNGRKLASTYYDQNEGTGVFALFDFNTATGEVTNPQKLLTLAPYQYPATQTGNLSQVSGVEFSPDSKRLYITMPDYYTENNGQWVHDGSRIFQYNLDVSSTQDIINSKTLLWSITQPPFYSIHSLQLALDGKIYASRHGTEYLSVIEKPNALGVACDFQLDNFYLGAGSADQGYGLPQFMPDNFQYEIVNDIYCYGESTQFQIDSHVGISAATWDFGDSSSSQNTSTDLAPTHVYTQPGTYIVTVELYNQFGTLIELEDEITILQGATATMPNDLAECQPDANTPAVFDLSQQDSVVLNGQDPSTYAVSYHTDLNDAENNSGAILPNNNYSATDGTTIYVRVTNTNTQCYDITSFMLQSAITPVAPTVSPIVSCDQDVLDGSVYFDLTQRENDLQAGQPNTLISYHLDPTEAVNAINAISDPTNFLRNNEQYIYVRITANDPAVDCYAIAQLELQVSQAPGAGSSLELTDCPPFDLTTVAAEFPSATIEGYFISSSDAQENTNALLTPEAYEDALNNSSVYLRLIDANGCGGIAQVDLTLDEECFFLPEGISPNGDGLNDSFDLSVLDAGYGVNNLVVYNRHGRNVFERANYTNEWIGQDMNGNNLPTGTYFYVLELDRSHPAYGQTIKKWVYVNRNVN